MMCSISGMGLAGCGHWGSAAGIIVTYRRAPGGTWRSSESELRDVDSAPILICERPQKSHRWSGSWRFRPECCVETQVEDVLQWNAANRAFGYTAGIEEQEGALAFLCVKF